MATLTDDKTPRNDSLISNLTGYLDTRIDIVRLETQEKVKGVFVSTVHGVALGVLGTCCSPCYFLSVSTRKYSRA
jgi:hypothetical protein